MLERGTRRVEDDSKTTSILDFDARIATDHQISEGKVHVKVGL